MTKILRYFGRILFIIVFLTSAFIKLRNPATLEKIYINSYKKIHSLHQTADLQFLPKQQQFNNNVLNIIKFIGLFQLLIALFIALGDKKGGLLALIYFTFICYIETFPLNYGDIQSWPIHNFIERQKFLQSLALIGLSLVLIKGEQQQFDQSEQYSE